MPLESQYSKTATISAYRPKGNKFLRGSDEMTDFDMMSMHPMNDATHNRRNFKSHQNIAPVLKERNSLNKKMSNTEKRKRGKSKPTTLKQADAKEVKVPIKKMKKSPTSVKNTKIKTKEKLSKTMKRILKKGKKLNKK